MLAPRLTDTAVDQRRRARMAAAIPDHGDGRICTAMAHIPRHSFVPADCAERAYEDTALPVWAGQTISQPSLIALMLATCGLRAGMRVLDLGAGTGYAAALIQAVEPMAEIIAVERIGALAKRARSACARWAPTVRVIHGDGLELDVRWGDFAVMHVACALAAVPDVVRARVAIGGVIVAPVGPHAGVQRLQIMRHERQGWRTDNGPDVQFVPGLAGVID